MKIAAVTFFDENEKQRSVLGMCEYDRTECVVLGGDDVHKYQIRSDDDGEGNPCTIENAVAINHFADFITDTKIDFPHKENAGGGYAIMDDLYEMSDRHFSEDSYDLMNELEVFRHNLLAKYIGDNLAEANKEDPVINSVNVDDFGNIHLNFYGTPYTVEIHNNKEFE